MKVLYKLIDAMEDNDDVQEIQTNRQREQTKVGRQRDRDLSGLEKYGTF